MSKKKTKERLSIYRPTLLKERIAELEVKNQRQRELLIRVQICMGVKRLPTTLMQDIENELRESGNE